MAGIDDIDRKILDTLRVRGRTPHAALAEEVGLSAPAVGERVRKLEQSGVIRRFEADLAPDRVGVPICAFVALAPKPGSVASDLVARLLALPEVQELHSVAGTYGYLAKVRVASTEILDVFLDSLMMLDGVERTETTMVLRTHAERPVPVPWAADPGPADDRSPRP